MTTFHLGDILTLVLGRQLSTSAPGASSLLAIVDHVHGERVPDFRLPRAMTATTAHLREVFPEFADLALDPGVSRAYWLAAQVERFGEQHEIPPIRTEADLVGASKES